VRFWYSSGGRGDCAVWLLGHRPHACLLGARSAIGRAGMADIAARRDRNVQVTHICGSDDATHAACGPKTRPSVQLSTVRCVTSNEGVLSAASAVASLHSPRPTVIRVRRFLMVHCQGKWLLTSSEAGGETGRKRCGRENAMMECGTKRLDVSEH
jgi:hypothetical protein